MNLTMDLTDYDKAFLKWMAEQPKDRSIDHSESWVECATGEYQREVIGTDSPEWDYYWIDNDVLRCTLGNPSEHNLGTTYGETVSYLKEQGFYSFME